MPDSPVWHILASLGSGMHAPGTIAVNVTWMERGFIFNAGQNASQFAACTHLPSTVYDSRYWSEIATFSYPRAFNGPLGLSPWTIFVIFGE